MQILKYFKKHFKKAEEGARDIGKAEEGAADIKLSVPGRCRQYMGPKEGKVSFCSRFIIADSETSFQANTHHFRRCRQHSIILYIFSKV